MKRFSKRDEGLHQLGLGSVDTYKNDRRRVYYLKKLIASMLILSMSFATSFSFAETVARDGEKMLLEENLFADVASNHWASPFIKSLKSSGIIGGYQDGSFRPSANVKIDEFIAMTVKALGYTYTPMSSDWAKPYIDKAIELKLILDKEFTSYNAQITREQLTSVIVNAATLSEYRPKNAMDLYIRNETKDYHLVSDYYKQNVLDSYKYGIITGFDDQTFRPKSYATRAEASAVLSKLLNKDLRKPFVKTNVKYVMLPTWDLDGFGNDITYEMAFYAPLYNGKPVNEIIEVAERIKNVSDGGKGYLPIAVSRFGELYSATGYESKELFKGIAELPNVYEQGIAYAERADFNFLVETDDFSSKYRPYNLTVYKKYERSDYEQPYSTYFYTHYEEQIRVIFKTLFEDEFETAWSTFKMALDYKGVSKRIEKNINHRIYDSVTSTNGIYLTISLKK